MKHRSWLRLESMSVGEVALRPGVKRERDHD
jgi:hypothetical protein